MLTVCNCTLRMSQSTTRSSASLIVSWPSLSDWMWSNWLQLNASKTEVLKCASARRQSQLPSSSIAVGSNSLTLYCCLHGTASGNRTAACLRPWCTSTTVIFYQISARCIWHLSCYHWWPRLPGGCCRLHLFGTVSQTSQSQFEHRCHCQFYAVDWRPSFLLGLTGH